jgi:hypothetical protein
MRTHVTAYIVATSPHEALSRINYWGSTDDATCKAHFRAHDSAQQLVRMTGTTLDTFDYVPQAVIPQALDP